MLTATRITMPGRPEQVRAARSRLEVGEGTRTDVAQADASRASAVAQLSAARAQELVSAATYRQVIGEDPGKLEAASAQTKLLPGNLGEAVSIAQAKHPAILASEFLVDAAGFNVKSFEGQLLPQITGSASVSRTGCSASTRAPAALTSCSSGSGSRRRPPRC